jgi:hypothetical protein
MQKGHFATLTFLDERCEIMGVNNNVTTVLLKISSLIKSE